MPCLFGDILSDQHNPSRMVLAAKNMGALTRFDVARLPPSRLRALLSGREALDKPWDFTIDKNPIGNNRAMFASPFTQYMIGYDPLSGRPGYVDQATGRMLIRSVPDSQRVSQVPVFELAPTALHLRALLPGSPEITPIRAWSEYFNFKQKPWYQKPIDATVSFCKHVAAVASAVWKAVHKDPVPTEKLS